MGNFISLDQYRAILKRNILSEPQMLVSNLTNPLGQISFQCAGDNFQMKDIIIPASRNAIDLTAQAPLENLLASSQLKSLLLLQKLALLNPADMPQPGQDIDQPALSTPPVAGALSVDGTTIPNAAVIVEQDGNVWAGTSNSSGVFTINVSGLVEGPFSITVTAEGFLPARYDFNAGPTPLQPYPAPTINAVFNETQVTGKTVADANVVVEFNTKTFTGQADDQGDFTVDVDALPFSEITVNFVADGYLPGTQKLIPDSVPGIASVAAVDYFATALTGTASPNAHVEITITGQANAFADADASGDWSATVQPIKGDVHVRSLEIEGYEEATAQVVPNKLTFGAITVDDADSFGESKTTVTGTIAGLNANATDLSVTVVTQGGTTEGTVVVATGKFTVNSIDAKTGPAGSTGVVTVTSAFYNDGSESFNILEEFAAPTINQAVDGDVAVTGTTVPATTVKITMGGVTKQVSSAVGTGAFSVTGFANVVPGPITVELTKTGYLKSTTSPTLAVQAHAIHNAVAVGATEITGAATPGATVKFTQGAVSGDAVAAAGTGDYTVTLSGPLVAGDVTIEVTLANYVTYTDTFAVA